MRDKRGCTPARHWSTTAPTRTAASAEFSTMESKTALITPEVAKDLLSRNTANRPLKRNDVEFLKTQLETGEWQLTHQGIAISDEGLLLDGQHRLKAIQETGISAEMMVTFNVPKNTFSVLDIGRKRCAADLLYIEGAQGATMAAAIKSYLLYLEKPSLAWRGNVHRLVSNLAVLKEYESDPEGWKSAQSITFRTQTKGLITPSPFTCFIYLALSKGHEFSVLEQFAINIKEGVALKKHDPILAYRNRCLLNFTKGLNGQLMLANYIKLFNYSFTMQELKLFKQQEAPPMPSLIGPHNY